MKRLILLIMSAITLIVLYNLSSHKNSLTWAELKAGTTLPEFPLQTFDGSPALLKYEEGQIKVQMKELIKPRALVIHFYQPDCLQCQAMMHQLQEIYHTYRERGLLIIGVAHRGDAENTSSLSKQLKLTYPLLIGTGQDLVRQLASGDALYIADSKGVVQFTQVGYGLGDEKEGSEKLSIF